jgi:hypothetical protein
MRFGILCETKERSDKQAETKLRGGKLFQKLLYFPLHPNKAVAIPKLHMQRLHRPAQSGI